MKFGGWYSIVVGILMILQWVFFLVTGSVPEVKTAPTSLAFHLVDEFLTALVLILGGSALLQRKAWGRPVLLVGLGMLLYTIIVSAGYFAQNGTWPLVGMFAILLILDLYCLRILIRPETRA